MCTACSALIEVAIPARRKAAVGSSILNYGAASFSTATVACSARRHLKATRRSCAHEIGWSCGRFSSIVDPISNEISADPTATTFPGGYGRKDTLSEYLCAFSKESGNSRRFFCRPGLRYRSHLRNEAYLRKLHTSVLARGKEALASVLHRSPREPIQSLTLLPVEMY